MSKEYTILLPLTRAATITIAIAIVLFELLPLTSWEVTAKVSVIIQVSSPPVASAADNINIIASKTQENEHVIAITPFSVGGGLGIYNMKTTIPHAKSSKLVHSSFRIDEHVIKALEKEAQKRGISLSSLVNKTLKDYVTSEMHFEDLGFILVSKDFLRKIFSRVDDKDIAEIGKEFGLTIAREYVAYFYPQVNGDTLVEFLDTIWFRRFQSRKHTVTDNKNTIWHCFTVNHDINIKFSLALKNILEALIEPVIERTVEFRELAPNTITFSFEV